MPEGNPDSLDAATPNVDPGEQLAALGIKPTGDAALDAKLARIARRGAPMPDRPDRQPDEALRFDLLEHARWRVVGGSQPYTIQHQDDGLVCDCPGFSYRRKCRHVAELMRRRSARRAREAT